MKSIFSELRIGNLTAKLPIIQGGMGIGISLSRLASAVANEGGIGVIAAAGIGMFEKDFVKNNLEANKRALRKEIQHARQKTNGIIGVNILMALTDFEELALVAIEEKVDIIFFGAGLPLKFLSILEKNKLENVNTKFIPIISSARTAKLIFHYWSKNYNKLPDAVVVEGPLAGGHLGYTKEQITDENFQLEKLIPEVKKEVKIWEEKYSKEIPVIAAGGIYTGKDILKFMQLGADGVQMATRFVGTFECDASDKFKNQYLNCKEEDIVIIESPVGLPGRAIKNTFLEDVSLGIKKAFTCPWHCLRTCDFETTPYCIALALTNAQKGRLNFGFAFAGANAYRVNKIISVKELINSLIEEFQEAVSNNKLQFQQ